MGSIGANVRMPADAGGPVLRHPASVAYFPSIDFRGHPLYYPHMRLTTRDIVLRAITVLRRWCAAYEARTVALNRQTDITTARLAFDRETLPLRKESMSIERRQLANSIRREKTAKQRLQLETSKEERIAANERRREEEKARAAAAKEAECPPSKSE